MTTVGVITKCSPVVHSIERWIQTRPYWHQGKSFLSLSQHTYLPTYLRSLLSHLHPHLQLLRSILEEAGLLICDGQRSTELNDVIELMAHAFKNIYELSSWAATAGSKGGGSPYGLTTTTAGTATAAAAAGGHLGQSKVVLSTMHGAKGQEFDLVFLAGWDEGVFPLLPRTKGTKVCMMTLLALPAQIPATSFIYVLFCMYR